jgi:ABC-type sugar transport system permease subunit
LAGGAFNQIIHGPSSNFLGGIYPPDFAILWDPVKTQFVVSVIRTWQWFGVSMILLMAGMQGIPKTYYEAADLEGASAVSYMLFIVTVVFSVIYLKLAARLSNKAYKLK